MSDVRKSAMELLTLEVTERIRVACGHLSEDDLASLAKSIATIELKYLGVASTTLGDRNTPASVPSQHPTKQ